MNTEFARTPNDKMIAGVCGGLAHYFGIDSTIVRLVFVLALLSGVTPLVYIVLWVIMPQRPTPAAATPSLPVHPRGVEEWKFDPYTGEKVVR